MSSTEIKGTREFRLRRVGHVLLLAVSLSEPLPALAADEPAREARLTTPQPSFPAPSAPASWQDTIKPSVEIETGIVANPARRGSNFGQLFTDRSNQPLVNQVLGGLERPTSPTADSADFGFKVQAMYGSDARYTHVLGEFDRSIASRNQVDVVEASISMHQPGIEEGSTDVKVGQFPSPLGYEVIDPKGNPLYS